MSDRGAVAAAAEALQLGTTSSLKITDAQVFVCSPGRNFVTLKIYTDGGIYGLGDATLNGRELAVASYLTDHVIPCLIGRDPFQTEDIWHYLYRGAYWRKGPVTMGDFSAVDVALWDIKAKALNTPLYNLLGGKVAHRGDGVRARQRRRRSRRPRGGARRRRTGSISRCARNAGCPACRHLRGLEGEAVYEPAKRAAGRKPLVIGGVYAPRAEVVRAPPDAARRGPAPPPRRSPSPDADRGRDGSARTWSHIGCSGWRTPARPSCRRDSGPSASTRPRRSRSARCSIGLGREAAHHGAADRLSADVGPRRWHYGAMKIAALADLYHVQIGSHGATDLSPVMMGAALRFDISTEQRRHPGVHAPHAGDARRLPARPLVCRRLHAARRRAGPRRRLRRGSSRHATRTSVPTFR